MTRALIYVDLWMFEEIGGGNDIGCIVVVMEARYILQVGIHLSTSPGRESASKPSSELMQFNVFFPQQWVTCHAWQRSIVMEAKSEEF